MKIILALLAVAALFSPMAFAQQNLQIGQPADQQLVIRISDNGDAHVKHIIKADSHSQQLQYVSISFVNFTITDTQGAEPLYGKSGDTSILVFPSQNDITVQYDIPGAVKIKDGLWTWNYLYLGDSIFYLPDSVKLFYINNNLVQFTDVKGFDCHGCQMKLEYELQPTIISKQVKWEDKSFDVKLMTLVDIPELRLDQKNMSLNFDLKDPNQHITLIIPKDLLGNPYSVSVNDKPILKQERVDSEGMVWLHIIPKEKGNVRIQGVTVVPEFPLASILVLSASMILVVYASRFSRR